MRYLSGSIIGCCLLKFTEQFTVFVCLLGSDLFLATTLRVSLESFIISGMTILTLKGFFPCYHGDLMSLVNSRYCVLIFCVLALCHVIMVSLYFRSPIDCFCPDHTTSLQCGMMTSYCGTPSLSTMYLTEADHEPSDDPVDDHPVQLGMTYHFASLVFLLQATMFYAPHVVSREMYRVFGIHPDELALSALEARRTRDPDERAAAIRDIALHVEALCACALRRGHASYGFGWLHRIRLSLVDVLTRTFYAANSIGQFHLLGAVLGVQFHAIGWSVIGRGPPSLRGLVVGALENAGVALDDLPAYVRSALLAANDTTGVLDTNGSGRISPVAARVEDHGFDLVQEAAPLFPAEAFCRFTTRTLGRPSVYVLHCALPLNRLNELIFTYVWFLLLGVAVVNCTWLAASVARLLMFPCRRMYVGDRLHDLGLLDDVEFDDVSDRIELFSRYFLGVDGTLLLGYVRAGAGDVISDATLANLWRMFSERSDEYDDLYKPVKTKESVIDDVIKVPTHRHREPDVDRPLASVYDPMQPPEVPLRQFDSAATFSKETPFSKPADFAEPPDYAITQRTDFDKLGLDDDFMV